MQASNKDLSDPGELRKAFRKAAARSHPDVEGGSDGSFRNVVEAYAVLQKGAADTKAGALKQAPDTQELEDAYSKNEPGVETKE